MRKSPEICHFRALFLTDSLRIVAADLVIEAVGIVLAILIYPPIAMFAIILAGCVVTFLPLIIQS